MGETEETYVEVLGATEFVAIVTHGDQGPHLVGTWGDYIRRFRPGTGTIIVPAGGYRQTERNLAKDNRITLLIASRHVQGSRGPGQGCAIEGTASLVTEGLIVDEVKGQFPWARGALIVTITKVVPQL